MKCYFKISRVIKAIRTFGNAKNQFFIQKITIIHNQASIQPRSFVKAFYHLNLFILLIEKTILHRMSIFSMTHKWIIVIFSVKHFVFVFPGALRICLITRLILKKFIFVINLYQVAGTKSNFIDFKRINAFSVGRSLCGKLFSVTTDVLHWHISFERSDQ
jgi:hypothetical protein